MNRARTGWLAVAVLAALPLLGLGPAAQARPAIYHTITSTHGFASYSQTDGCLRTDAFVSSSDAMYAAQPGPVNKQGLTALAVTVTDVCARAGGGGGVVVFDGMGMLDTPLVARPRLTLASVEATIPLADDVSGTTVEGRLWVSWTGIGPITHDTGHSHTRFPLAGIVNGHGNSWMRSATATVTVDVPGVTRVTGTSTDAVLEKVKAGCMEIRWPHYTGDSLWCFRSPE